MNQARQSLHQAPVSTHDFGSMIKGINLVPFIKEMRWQAAAFARSALDSGLSILGSHAMTGLTSQGWQLLTGERCTPDIVRVSHCALNMRHVFVLCPGPEAENSLRARCTFGACNGWRAAAGGSPAATAADGFRVALARRNRAVHGKSLHSVTCLRVQGT